MAAEVDSGLAGCLSCGDQGTVGRRRRIFVELVQHPRKLSPLVHSKGKKRSEVVAQVLSERWMSSAGWWAEMFLRLSELQAIADLMAKAKRSAASPLSRHAPTRPLINVIV